MRKFTFLLVQTFLILGAVSAADFENLYVVGNACEAGWDPNKALEMTKEPDGTFSWNGNLIAPSGEQQRFKFIVARDWHPSITCRLDIDGHLMVESEGEYDLFVRPDGDTGYDNAFQVPHSGEYTIDINLATMKMTIIQIGEVEEPTPDLTQLYINGSALSIDGQWDYDNPLEMMMIDPGVFTWTGDLFNAAEGQNEFKFKNVTDSWDKTFCSTQANTFITTGDFDLHFRPYESSPNDFNFKVATEGFYTIKVDLNTMKMTVIDEFNAGIGFTHNSLRQLIQVSGNSVTVLNSNKEVQRATIYNVTGSVLRTIAHEEGSIMLADNLQHGVFIVRLDAGNNYFVQKIVIQ